MRKSYVWFRLLRVLFHAACMILVFLVMYILRLRTDLIPGVQIHIPEVHIADLSLFVFFAILVFVCWGIYHHYYQLFYPMVKNYRKLLTVRAYWFVSMTFVAYLGDGYLFVYGISRLIWVRTAVVFLLVVAGVDWLWLWGERRMYKHNHLRALLIYQDQQEYALIRPRINQRMYTQIDVCERQHVVLSSLATYDHIILIGVYEKAELQILYDQARLAGRRFFHIAQQFFLEDVLYRSDRLGSVMAFEYQATRLQGWMVVVKRCMDIFGSFIALVLLAPLMLIVALLIRLDTPGPILYKQMRVGRNGRHFMFIKFRSMYIDDCVGERYGGDKARKKREKLMNSALNIRKGELQKIINDPRVTPVGKFIRRTSLDELPNLFSVLR